MYANETCSEERQTLHQGQQSERSARHELEGKGVNRPPPQKTTLICRVHAIITVPVKEEDNEDPKEIVQEEELELRRSSLPAQSGNLAVPRKRRAIVEGETSGSRQRKRPAIHEDTSLGERSGSGEDEGEASEEENGDEDELLIGNEVCANYLKFKLLTSFFLWNAAG